MPESIKVVVRFRAKNDQQADYDYFISKNSIQLKTETYKFDNIFESISQEDLFINVAKGAIEWVVEGYNSTIFAYGPTGTGKSYTMFGTEAEPGIIPRACKVLFNLLQKKELENFYVKCTFLEIYRENIRDLIHTDRKDDANLRIRQGENGNYVKGLTERYVTSAEDILQIIQEGAKYRMVASTALNNVSSRSHAVLTITINQTLPDGTVSSSKLHMVDLAGSENVSKSEVQGVSLLEAQMINKSLSSLGNVIYALTEKGREHIPYRDSKLTYLLQDSLGGNSKAILIATASTNITMYNETISTFKFATRANQIKNQPKINKQRSVDTLELEVENWMRKYEEMKQKYDEDCFILKQVASKPAENQQLTLLQMKHERLQTRIQYYETRLENEQNRYKDMNTLFQKHKTLLQNVADNLYESRIQQANTMATLRSYQQFYQTVIECAEKNPGILELVVKNKKFPVINNE